MDELEEWLLQDILDCLPYADKAIWETSRLQCYLTAQVNSKKQLSPKDIMQLPWDFSETEPLETTPEEHQRLQRLATNFWKKTEEA